jgi:hypothetical protein
MKTHITILEGDKASTKHYSIDPETNVACKGDVSTSYLHNSLTIGIENLADLYDVLQSVRTNPCAFIIRGKGIEEVQVGVRRLKDEHFVEEPTAWVCLDFDEWDLKAMEYNVWPPERTSHTAIEHIIQWDLPREFHNVSYIYQWSSSAGLEYNNKVIKKGTNLHLFFMLDRALNERELIAWLENIGPIGKAFDTSVFRTVTPIFVGNHIVKDARITDVIDEERKFSVVVKDQLEVPVPEIEIKEQHIELDSISFETSNEILSKLQSIGAVYKRTGSWIKLKHPLEINSPGSWHVRYDSPKVVHHHVKKSMSVSRWLKEFHGLDVEFTYEKRDIMAPIRFESAQLSRDIKDMML